MQVNPYQASGDTSQECYSWAADGQCTLNPGHMLSQCKYSCWEWYEYRAKKFPDAPMCAAARPRTRRRWVAKPHLAHVQSNVRLVQPPTRS